MTMLMLLDKSYFDYDFEAAPEPVVTMEDTMLSEEKVTALTRRFGFGVSVDYDTSAEDLQLHAMEDINK